MRLAFMITAYVDPNHLARLVKALDEEERDFYIHIDRKKDAQPFKKYVYSEVKKSNVFFVPDEMRVSVYWGGYSQIKMQLVLMKLILESNVKYDRIVHLTGTDYPLWSNKKINDYFIKNASIQFIMGYNFENVTNPIRAYKVCRYWFFDMRRYKGFRHIEPCIRHFANLFEKHKKNQMRKTGYTFYYGSEYWALTLDCLEYVYVTYLKDTQLQKLMKTSFVPSEIYVQTILYNSSYRNNLFGTPQYNIDRVSRLAPLHFFLYEERVQEFDEYDYPMICYFNKMFFRKAKSGFSDRLLNMVDERRQNDL